ncbi:pitrilysin family protein [Neomegalonema sp.]|uniref:M16 family metallopeptidase n=1 Tax=Neomegalonema sp. TaxID=2039713 RepID=UPI00262114B0|nr:M16 family metallopeptidase [Neomegalonema sp.]MDD2868233.1 insulinase family protein [Neomegalonema sp.]
MMQLRLALAVLFALLTPLAAEASEAPFAAPPPGRLEEYRLANGLQVILLPDPRTPKVAMELRYDVGSAREPSGLSGFSHLFEHLMFMGTPAAPDFDAPLAAAGVVANAFTSEDGVRYQMEGPSVALPLMLALEADRMANLGPSLDQADLDLQREVVLNEMRQNVADAPGFGPQEALASALYPEDHPYRRPVIGALADLEAATLEDARRFFDLYYRPSNATLALAGDFEPQEARRLVEESFGALPWSTPPPPVAPPAPFPASRARLTFEDALPAVTLFLEWTGPPVGSEGDEALRVAAVALTDDSMGVLRRKLVLERRAATQVAALWTPLRLGGRFAVVATAAEGVDAETLEAETRQALAEILAGGLPRLEVRAAARRLATELVEAEERLAQRARYAVDAHLNLGSASLRAMAARRLSQVDAPRADAALRAVARLEEASVGIIHPGPRGGLPQALLGPTGPRALLPPPVRPRTATPIPPPPPAPEAPTFPEPALLTLPNGLRLLHFHRPDAALAYLALVAPGGEALDPPGHEGLVATMAEMIGRNPVTARRLAYMGGAASANVSATHVAALLTAPRQEFERALQDFARALLAPEPDQALWETTLARRRLAASYARSYAPSLAAEVVKADFYGLETRAGRSETPESLTGLTLEEALALHRRIFRPDGAQAVLVADLSSGEAERLMVQAFGAWRGAAPRRPEENPGAPPPERFVGLADSQGAAQAAFTARIGGPELAPPTAALETAARALGGGFVSRLNRVLREEKGFTYSASGGLIDRGLKQGVIWLDSSFNAENAAEALEETWRILGSLRTDPVTPRELNAARLGRLREDLDALETTRGLFGAAVWEAMDGRDLAARALRSTEIRETTLAEVRAAGALIAEAAERGVYALAGESARLEDELAARGIPFRSVAETMGTASIGGWPSGQGDEADPPGPLRSWAACGSGAAFPPPPLCAPTPPGKPRPMFPR